MVRRIMYALIWCSGCSMSAYAQQSGGARATGEVIGRLIAYALLLFLLFRFIIRPLFRKKRK